MVFYVVSLCFLLSKAPDLDFRKFAEEQGKDRGLPLVMLWRYQVDPGWYFQNRQYSNMIKNPNMIYLYCLDILFFDCININIDL